MAFKVITESDPIKVESLCTVLYGEPGIGKTSLSFTSNQPLLLDFDKGLKRAIGRKTAISLERWEDVSEFLRSPEFAETQTKTLIIDTAGTMLDNYIAGYVIRQDTKNSRGGGELSLQGYGAMKSVFKQFVNELKSRNIDIVFVAHSESVKDGDNLKFQPKMTGGSYATLMEVADMVGYVENIGGKRTIDFNPTNRHTGKNTAEFPVMEVPHYSDAAYESFLGNLINKTKTKMASLTDAQVEAQNKVRDFRAQVDEASTPEQLDDLMPAIQGLDKTTRPQLEKYHGDKYKAIMDHYVGQVNNADEANMLLGMVLAAPINLQKGMKVSLWNRSKALGLGFNEATKTFLAPAGELPPSDEIPEPVESEPKEVDGLFPVQ